MADIILHGLPVMLAVLSFWSNTEKKLLLLNLSLCLSMALLMLYMQAWGGMLVMLVAGGCTSYRLATQRLLNSALTGVLITLMSVMIGVINLHTINQGWLEILPMLTFIFYRFGELYCREPELRLCMVAGSGLFTLYGLITQSWGVALTEALFAASNAWYYLRLRRNAVRMAP
ncbi:YgjV family protein [Alteromonas sp. CYL-A6]|uniref:YgjV family protein n=1 Tax=Alteromonas nitratireducens TaxID=3390813 RepID=UPI0034C29C3A